MSGFIEKYAEFEKDVVTAFRDKYSLWDDVKEEDMDICSNGDVFVGATQFVTGIHCKNYIE